MHPFINTDTPLFPNTHRYMVRKTIRFRTPSYRCLSKWQYVTNRGRPNTIAASHPPRWCWVGYEIEYDTWYETWYETWYGTSVAWDCRLMSKTYWHIYLACGHTRFLFRGASGLIQPKVPFQSVTLPVILDGRTIILSWVWGRYTFVHKSKYKHVMSIVWLGWIS